MARYQIAAHLLFLQYMQQATCLVLAVDVCDVLSKKNVRHYLGLTDLHNTIQLPLLYNEWLATESNP